MTITGLVTPTYFASPAPAKRRFQLLDVATVVENNEWLGTEGLIEGYNCLSTNSVAILPCPEPEGEPDPKTFDNSPQWQDGIKFAGYTGLVCKSIGYDNAHGEAEIQRVYLANESIAVEKALMAQRFVENADDADLWAAAEDVTPTPGTAVGLEYGLALLEGHGALNYAGQVTIHVSPTVASLLLSENAIKVEGNTLLTKLGNKVAAGAGYEDNTGPDGEAADPGDYWMYATGEVVVARSPLQVNSEMDRSTNEMFTLVERIYVATVDCYTAAVLVEV